MSMTRPLKELEIEGANLQAVMQNQFFASLLRPKVGWKANKSLHLSPGSSSTSAARFTSLGASVEPVGDQRAERNEAVWFDCKLGGQARAVKHSLSSLRQIR